MGEVFLARDSRLDRPVALKVVAAHATVEPEHRARFEREGRAVSRLNHPHICTLYDVGYHDGIAFLVMERLEGETLRERLKNGPLPLEQAVGRGIEIADALHDAHSHGVLHRDLKPANVMLTRTGAKLLDFGLARLQTPPLAPAEWSSEISTAVDEEPLTEEGKLLGTFHYMAPEQLEGKQADNRADIWALGCVLYEMVTGRRAFDAGSRAALVSCILDKHPPPIGSLRPDVPKALEHAISTCLAKNAGERWQSAGDLKRVLLFTADDIARGAQEVPGTHAAAEDTPAWRRHAGWAVAAGLLLTLVGTVFHVTLGRELPAELSARLTINLPDHALLTPVASLPPPADGRPSLALSRDGRRLVYVALVGGETRLFARDMTTAEVGPIPGTDGASAPFLSPDGEWVAYFANGKLKKTALATGETMVLTDAQGPGGAWSDDDLLYFNLNEGGGIHSIAAGGGNTTRRIAGQSLWPEALPDGRGLLFSDLRGGVFLFKDDRIERLCRGSYPHYSPSGHLLVSELGKLLAVPFDLGAAKVTGPAVTVLQDLRTEIFGGAQYTLSRDGMLVYVAGADSQVASLVWVDRHGRAEPLGFPPAAYGPFDISPDGRTLAVPVFEGGAADLWLYDIPRGAGTRLTFQTKGEPRINTGPRWAPDGNGIIYTSYWQAEGGGPGLRSALFWKAVDGREAVQLTPDDVPMRPAAGSFAPDGSVLALYATSPDTGFDLWSLRLHGLDRSTAASPTAEVFLRTSFLEAFPRFSPDGKWIAYMSDESGRREIYVRQYPGAGGKVQVSTVGGLRPTWHPSGRELFYQLRNQWYAVEVAPSTPFRVGRPRLLFEGPYISVPGFSWALAPDGERFLVLENPEQFRARRELTVVTRFFDEVRRRIGARRG
jgi:serine/threonine-protein kinase